jgi:hypothetical protein
VDPPASRLTDTIKEDQGTGGSARMGWILGQRFGAALMKSMTERQLVKMILSLIEAQGRCLINDQLLSEVLDLRPDLSINKIKPLVDPFQERLAAFCIRYQLRIEPSTINGRTLFVAQSESETIA